MTNQLTNGQKLEAVRGWIVESCPEIGKICEICEGKGIKECSNPDHGFIMAISCVGNRSASESQCPECGYKGFSKCDDCSGKGIISSSPIGICEVLRTMRDSHTEPVGISINGCFLDCDENCNNMKELSAEWNLSDDDLNTQSPELVSFLYSLIPSVK